MSSVRRHSVREPGADPVGILDLRLLPTGRVCAVLVNCWCHGDEEERQTIRQWSDEHPFILAAFIEDTSKHPFSAGSAWHTFCGAMRFRLAEAGSRYRKVIGREV